MLLGFLALYFNGPVRRRTRSTSSSSRPTARPGGFAHSFQLIVFGASRLGFAVKVPMWPFHTWLPDAHTEAPTVGSVLLAGIMLKMGTYGFIRIALPMLPDAARRRTRRGSASSRRSRSSTRRSRASRRRT